MYMYKKGVILLYSVNVVHLWSVSGVRVHVYVVELVGL